MAQDLFDVKPNIRERAHLQSMQEYQRLYRRVKFQIDTEAAR